MFRDWDENAVVGGAATVAEEDDGAVETKAGVHVVLTEDVAALASNLASDNAASTDGVDIKKGLSETVSNREVDVGSVLTGVKSDPVWVVNVLECEAKYWYS